MPSKVPPGLVIAAGTYDGVLAGWEFNEKEKMVLTFATVVHEGSIRSLSIAASAQPDIPGSILSCGYDEALRTHDWNKRVTSSGEIRTPSDFGTPVCSSFAPPSRHSTHCILGFTNGKVCIYKQKDWSVQHVLAGHEGGVSSLAVHPSGKLALSGGNSDGKLKLWDLTKGRLSFVDKIKPASAQRGKTHYDPISSMTWSNDGSFFGLSHGSHITVREVATGRDLLDVDLPSRVNEIALLSGPEGLFVVAACNDGSLPVLAVEDSDDESRRAIMAIEPVDSHLAGEERFKCLKAVKGYFVVTANSAGVVSVMNLEGAIKMIMSGSDDASDDDDASAASSGDSDDNEADNGMDLAVDIVETTQLGSGARITCLAAWCRQDETEPEEEVDKRERSPKHQTRKTKEPEENTLKRKQNGQDITMDAAAVKKARSLVKKAKTMKDKKEKKKTKVSIQ
jgi:protein MAK11